MAVWRLVRSQTCELYVSGMWTTCLSLPRGLERILDWKLGGPDYSEKAVTEKRLQTVWLCNSHIPRDRQGLL